MADDYIHRPGSSESEDLCSYQTAMKFKKKFLAFKQMNAMEEAMANSDGDCDDDEKDNNNSANYAEIFQVTFMNLVPVIPEVSFATLLCCNPARWQNLLPG